MAEDGGEEKASGSTPSVFISYASPGCAPLPKPPCEALERCRRNVLDCSEGRDPGRVLCR